MAGAHCQLRRGSERRAKFGEQRAFAVLEVRRSERLWAPIPSLLLQPALTQQRRTSDDCEPLSEKVDAYAGVGLLRAEQMDAHHRGQRVVGTDGEPESNCEGEEEEWKKKVMKAAAVDQWGHNDQSLPQLANNKSSNLNLTPTYVTGWRFIGILLSNKGIVYSKLILDHHVCIRARKWPKKIDIHGWLNERRILSK